MELSQTPLPFSVWRCVKRVFSQKKVRFPWFIHLFAINLIIFSHTFQYPFFHSFHWFEVLKFRPPFVSPLFSRSRLKAGPTKTVGLNSRFFYDLIAMNSLNLYRSLGFLTCQPKHRDVETRYFIFIKEKLAADGHI
jgi:hypothetical protein